MYDASVFSDYVPLAAQERPVPVQPGQENVPPSPTAFIPLNERVYWTRENGHFVKYHKMDISMDYKFDDGGGGGRAGYGYMGEPHDKAEVLKRKTPMDDLFPKIRIVTVDDKASTSSGCKDTANNVVGRGSPPETDIRDTTSVPNMERSDSSSSINDFMIRAQSLDSAEALDTEETDLKLDTDIEERRFFINENQCADRAVKWADIDGYTLPPEPTFADVPKRKWFVDACLCEDDNRVVKWTDDDGYLLPAEPGN